MLRPTEITLLSKVRQGSAVDSGFSIGRDYENGLVLLSGQEATDAIPVSAMDHSKEAIIIFDLSGLDAVSLEAELGVDAFPGD